MMIIQEQLERVNNTFLQLHQSFLQIEEKKKGLLQEYAEREKRIRENYTHQRAPLLQDKDDVLKFYRIAKDNSRKELVHNANKRKTDIARLNTMVSQINTSSRDDYIAGQIIDLASGFIVFIDDQLSVIDKQENADIEKNKRNQKNEEDRLENEKKNVLIECKRYLQGKDIEELVKLFNMIHRDYEITADYFASWGISKKRKKMMLLGFQQYPLDVPQMLCHILKSSLGEHFDTTTKNVNCPIGYITGNQEEIHVEYTDLNERLLFSGVQAIILNYLRYFRPTEFKVTLLDYVHYNSTVLGPLARFAAGKNSFIEIVPSSDKALRQTISILADYYRKIERKTGVVSVYDYNRKCAVEDRIPLRILILNRNEESFRLSDEGDISYLVNNSKKLGLVVVHMTKSKDGGSKGKEREKKYLSKGNEYIRVISDDNGNFYIKNKNEWRSFTWLISPEILPDGFVTKVLSLMQRKEKGTKYFSRYEMQVPHKSIKERRKIEIPFGVDDDDKAFSCSFENETFAAYIMGAAGSGKSTLLHTIICGILMGYHPDEVELWLLDFKMLEFKRYVENKPPHIRYLLLEKSEDLVFDIIDQLTGELNKRQYLFSQQGWSKLSDVPADLNIPAIFVIIDEFAQMSQILRETKGMGTDQDYTIKLENLLAKGRALGMKFIFASQTYTTGISGLTETACKQIQMRFALKNTPEEIKQTLTLSTDEITPQLSRSIYSLPAYESLFKWRDNAGEVRVGRFRNMYIEGNEIDNLIAMINQAYHAVPKGKQTGDDSYVEKNAVLIDGNQPKTFASQVQYYKEYEKSIDEDDYDETDIFVYPGVPCSFTLARPFLLCNGTAENILIAGGKRDDKVNILLSIMKCYVRSGNPIEIWTHPRAGIYRKYKHTVLSKQSIHTDLNEVCNRIMSIKRTIQQRRVNPRLVVCLGYEYFASDMELFDEAPSFEHDMMTQESPAEESLPDMSEILRLAAQCSDPEEKRRIIEEYNQRCAKQQAKSQHIEEETHADSGYDARSDITWILKRASNFGVHFLFCFDHGQDFINQKLEGNAFRHKLLFSMSRDESSFIAGNRMASEVDDGVCVYTNGKVAFTIRPHIYRGVPCNGWIIDDSGQIVNRT